MNPPVENLYDITSEVRKKPQDLLDDLMDSLDLDELEMLQIALQYTLSKLKKEVDEFKYLPLFFD